MIYDIEILRKYIEGVAGTGAQTASGIYMKRKA